MFYSRLKPVTIAGRKEEGLYFYFQFQKYQSTVSYIKVISHALL